MRYQFTVNEQDVAIEATRKGNLLVVECDGQQLEVRVVSAENNCLILLHNGRILRVAGNRSDDNRQLCVNGRRVDYRRVTEGGNSAESATGSLSASIPAVVSEILVSVGDRVAAGDKLILLESMKMIIPIQAPAAGIIGAIHCAAGDSVQPNVPLIQLNNE